MPATTGCPLCSLFPFARSKLLPRTKTLKAIFNVFNKNVILRNGPTSALREPAVSGEKLCGTNHVQSVANRWQRRLRLIPCLVPVASTFGRVRRSALQRVGLPCSKTESASRRFRFVRKVYRGWCDSKLTSSARDRRKASTIKRDVCRPISLNSKCRAAQLLCAIRPEEFASSPAGANPILCGDEHV
jgi:hypothetical protein